MRYRYEVLRLNQEDLWQVDEWGRSGWKVVSITPGPQFTVMLERPEE